MSRTNKAMNGGNKPQTSSLLASIHPFGRSRVSNGTSLFAEHVDERTTWARRFRDLVASYVDDLGGPDGLSGAQRSLIRRIAALEIELERMECAFATDDGGSNRMLDRYERMSNNLRRLLTTLGLRKEGQ